MMRIPQHFCTAHVDKKTGSEEQTQERLPKYDLDPVASPFLIDLVDFINFDLTPAGKCWQSYILYFKQHFLNQSLAIIQQIQHVQSASVKIFQKIRFIAITPKSMRS